MLRPAFGGRGVARNIQRLVIGKTTTQDADTDTSGINRYYRVSFLQYDNVNDIKTRSHSTVFDARNKQQHNVVGVDGVWPLP